jgi:hypothetical protein
MMAETVDRPRAECNRLPASNVRKGTMRTRRTAIAVIGTLAVLVPGAALGGSVTFTDPDDFEVAPDVHSTTKASFVSETRGARVRFRVRGELGPDFRLRVLVDSRRGDRADYVLLMDMRDFEVASCSARRLFQEAIEATCGGNIDRVWWDIPRHQLHADKRIRWRVVGFSWPDYTSVSDRAPDVGFYR